MPSGHHCHLPTTKLQPCDPCPHAPNLGEPLQRDFQTEAHTIRTNTEETRSSLAWSLCLSTDLEIRNSSWDH